ncbi:MAG: peptidoglycan -binding protein [Beijerinckiaceae bacterium]
MSSFARSRRRHQTVDYWPGFVDALASLVLIVVFLLAVFMMAQFFLSREVSGRDDALTKLNRQIAELTDLLSLERTTGRGREETISALSATLDNARSEAAQLRAGAAVLGSAVATGAETQRVLESERSLSARAAAQVEILNQQITALRRQLAALEEALNATDQKDKESQTRIADLGSRLNLALAQRVQELTRFRSDFFGRLRNVLANRPEFRVVGDRFVIQSEILFEPGQAALNPAGLPELDKLAAALTDVAREIPPDIAWVLRVDGHTDRRPINTAQFPSNWELSSARSIAVVRYLATRGIPENRLLAAGFAEFQPIEEGDTDETRRRNRRIELKLTER